MKTFLLFALILCTITTRAANYYFSNVSGDDSRNSFEAQNPISPWKTLDKVNSFSDNLEPGDSVLLKRGETFYGTIKIHASGSVVFPVVIGAYGTGADPVVTGLLSLTWVSAGNDLWDANRALGLDSLNMVTVKGIPAGMGRWPNLDNGNGGYNTIRSATSKTTTDEIGLKINPSQGKPTYFVGSEIVVRTERWLLDRHPITRYDAAKSIITFNPASTNEVAGANMGYFIQDNSSVLDRQNEWWYNRATKKIKMYSNGSPENVSAANLQNLFTCSGKSYITVNNITFNGSNGDAIYILNGSNIIIQNCTIQNIGRNAINSHARYCSFLNNTMINIMSKGVLINKQADHNIMRYNTLKNIGQIPGLGTSQREDDLSSFSGNGVFIKERASIIEYNSFVNIGSSAVHVNKVDSVIIRYNFIDTVCNVYDDGGGIYTYTGDPYLNYGRKITNNIILHGIGACYGSGVSLKIAKGAGVAGIYTNRNSSDIEIDSNTIACFEKGIFINYGCTRLTIRHNTVYNNVHGIQVNTRVKDGDKTRNLTITGNILLAATKLQDAMYLYSDDGDVLNTLGAIDSNYYARPINDSITMSYQTNQGLANLYNVSLSGWQAKFPVYDAHSKKCLWVITDTSQLRFEYNTTKANKTISLNGSYVDIQGNTYSNSLTLKPFTSVVLVKTNGGGSKEASSVFITSRLANEKVTVPPSINISAIKIWPNPVGNILSVFTKGLINYKEVKVSIYSISGTLVKIITQNAGSQVIQVNVSSLNAGFYLIKLSAKDVTIYTQFEKQ